MGRTRSPEYCCWSGHSAKATRPPFWPKSSARSWGLMSTSSLRGEEIQGKMGDEKQETSFPCRLLGRGGMSHINKDRLRKYQPANHWPKLKAQNPHSSPLLTETPSSLDSKNLPAALHCFNHIKMWGHVFFLQEECHPEEGPRNKENL